MEKCNHSASCLQNGGKKLITRQCFANLEKDRNHNSSCMYTQTHIPYVFVLFRGAATKAKLTPTQTYKIQNVS